MSGEKGYECIPSKSDNCRTPQATNLSHRHILLPEWASDKHRAYYHYLCTFEGKEYCTKSNMGGGCDK